jgi:uncharacterized SAM-binding protein YcdF (DUF218 family)
MHVLLSPLTWSILLLLWRRFTRHRGLMRMQSAGLLFCLVLATPVGANSLVWLIENKLPVGPPCTADDTSPLLILTGGFTDTPRDVDDFTALTATSLRRLSGGLDVASRNTAVRVIVSGGALAGRTAEASVAAALATRLGLDASRLIIDARSMSTWQNAREVSGLLPPDVRHVQLVTSALHAPRATLALRAHGIASCRHVTDSLFVPMSGFGYFLPQSSALRKTELSLHEAIGLLSYQLKSSTSGSPSP